MSQIYGYARVSTDGQTLDLQVAQIRAAGAEQVFKETVSGAKRERAQLQKLLHRLEPEDVLLVTRLDRLTRSTRDLLNILGHFALSARLLPLLQRARGPRVVSLSSVAARGGAIDLADLQFERSYRPMQAYSQSKLACLMFAIELQRRSDAAGWGLACIAAYPGVARTDLIPNGAGRWSVAGVIRTLLPVLFQPAEQGAWPSLFAATALEAAPGGYYGPDRLSETRGHPVPARVPPAALDGSVAAQLWSRSEELVGVQFGETP